MESTENNALSTSDLGRVSQIISDKGGPARFFNWLESIQSDLIKMPNILRQADLVGGLNFPELPPDKVGLLFLSSGTYEAVIIGGIDKWRRLYDGTTYDPATAAP
jgi:hypothetical protein